MNAHLWLAGLAAVVLAGPQSLEQPVERGTKFSFQEQDTIRRTFRVSSGGASSIELSNVSGAVVATGGAAGAVDVVAERTVSATTEANLEAARRASTPVMTESATGISILGAPDMRRGCNDAMEWRARPDERTVKVQTRFHVRVPSDSTLRLCTVNGAVTVSGVNGAVTVIGVNGGIDARDVGGPLDLRTVNGHVLADLHARPTRDSVLHSVNGDLTLMLPAETRADLLLKTTNGGIFTDFDTTALPTPAPVVEQRNGTRVYRTNRAVAVRVGMGGPSFSLETLNGDVSVRRR